MTIVRSWLCYITLIYSCYMINIILFLSFTSSFCTILKLRVFVNCCNFENGVKRWYEYKKWKAVYFSMHEVNMYYFRKPIDQWFSYMAYISPSNWDILIQQAMVYRFLINENKKTLIKYVHSFHYLSNTYFIF